MFCSVDMHLQCLVSIYLTLNRPWHTDFELPAIRPSLYLIKLYRRFDSPCHHTLKRQTERR